MAWDFETDPEFQEQLEWIDEFVRGKLNRSISLSLLPTT